MKITKIDIITRPSKLEDLKDALNKIGVHGMTVSQVYGAGLQRGHKEVYRGREYEVNLVPKIKLETVVCEIPVEKVLEVAQKVLRTGKFIDEKSTKKFSFKNPTTQSEFTQDTATLKRLWTFLARRQNDWR